MKYSIKALSKEQRETAEKNGIKRSTLANRLKDGWDLDRAVTERTRSVSDVKTSTVNTEGELVSISWFSGTNRGLRCPVEGCEHVGEVITKAHCRIVHGMEREEVNKKYGMPIIVEGKPLQEINTQKSSQWYSTSNGMGAL